GPGDRPHQPAHRVEIPRGGEADPGGGARRPLRDELEAFEGGGGGGGGGRGRGGHGRPMVARFRISGDGAGAISGSLRRLMAKPWKLTSFAAVEGALQELERSPSPRLTGGWTVPQMLAHCAQS